MKIKVYTSPACLYCHQLKDFLKEKKIEFEEIDLSKNQEMIDDFIKKTGQMAVPVTEIDGEMILGFDLSKIKEKLNIE
ncbi:MAG: glutaredoxin domain-containing protein [Patescibacteria group bacterium]|jgi:glutaredoxin|nr:glutaredoxin domain-containing protein [Patescibacteria group bacterium]MDD5172583.1 glutaredoxin domain-containing protein [Patescibacteria group bacterium]